ncbi:transposase [Enterococcus sp. RIT-PI-f]
MCKIKDVKIFETHTMSGHIQLLVRILPNIIISSFMGYLKK